MLARAEEDEQGQLRADEALAGPGGRGQDQVGHGVGRRVDSPQAGAAQALAARDGLETLQPARDKTQRHTGHICCRVKPHATHANETNTHTRYTC